MNPESILKDPFFKKVENFVIKNNLISKGEKILCAVSGGPDSVALLNVLLALKDKYSIELRVAHLEHGIRGRDSRRDQEFVEKISRKLNIRFYTKNIKLGDIKKGGESVEEVARRERIKFFKEVCTDINCDKIALGHTFDDYIETIIFRLINGTGQKGIKGIKVSNNGIIRPLLGVTKEEILNFLNRHSIKYMEDVTNLDLRYSRNRIRHRIIPEMKIINVKYRDHIKNFIELVSEDDSFIGTLLDDYLKRTVYQIDKSEIRVMFDPFYNFHPSIKKRIILRIIEVLFDLKSIDNVYLSYKAIKSITDKKPDKNKTLYSDKFITISSEYGELVFKKSVVENINREYLYSVNKGDTEIFIKEIGRRILFKVIDRQELKKFEIDKLYFDVEKINYPLVIRNKRSGDRINLPNLGFKKLKSIFINDKVKPLERSLVPIILVGEKIAGIFCSYYGRINRVAKDYMVDGETKKILICSLENI